MDLVVQGALFSSTQQPHGEACHRGAAWENIRYLDIDLLCRVPDLPYIFTDFEGRERAAHIEDYFGLKIKEVSHDIMWYNDPVVDADQDDADDPDYQPSGSEVSDYNTSDQSDLEPDELRGPLLTSYGALKTQQLSELEALDIFSRTVAQSSAVFPG